MADDKEKIVRQLNDELDQLNLKLSSISANLKERLINKLADANGEVLKLVDQFEKGEDLTKVISNTAAEIAKNLKENNRLSFNRNKLESDLSRAIQNNNLFAERKIRIALRQNQLTIEQLDATTQLLTKIKDLAEEEVRITEEKKKQNSIAGASRKIFEDFTKQYKDLFTIEGVLKLIIESALNFNKISVDLGKNLAYGADNADRVTSNFVNIARYATNINVTTKNLAEAFNQISETTGFVAEYSANALETQIMLTKQFGLTSNEAAKIYEFSVLTGKSSSQVNKNMVAAFVAARNQLGVGIPFKATIAEAAKVSGQLAANLKNNPEFIVKAVAQAKALGTTLEQTKNQGEALLNFESSIENELKAELLTGKALNLERARAAALMGDQVTVAKELANQGMTLEKFQNMNVLAQQSFAAAIGLSSDQLANQLRMQKIAIESGKSLAQITEEEALEAQKRQNIQDKFNASILKLQDFFGNLISGPLGSFLELLTQSLGLINSIGAGLLVWQATSKAIAISQAAIAWYSKQKVISDRLGVGVGNIMIAQLGRMLGLSTAKAAADSISATALSFGTLLPLLLGAGATIYTLLSSFNTMDDGAMGPNGKILFSKQAGAVKLNDNDTVLAGTNLFGNGKPSSQQSADNSGVIAAINSLQETLKSKNFSPIMKADGIVMATVTAQNSYNLA